MKLQDPSENHPPHCKLKVPPLVVIPEGSPAKTVVDLSSEPSMWPKTIEVFIDALNLFAVEPALDLGEAITKTEAGIDKNHSLAISNLASELAAQKSSFENECNAIQKKVTETISEAQSIMRSAGIQIPNISQGASQANQLTAKGSDSNTKDEIHGQISIRKILGRAQQHASELDQLFEGRIKHANVKSADSSVEGSFSAAGIIWFISFILIWNTWGADLKGFVETFIFSLKWSVIVSAASFFVVYFFVRTLPAGEVKQTYEELLSKQSKVSMEITLARDASVELRETTMINLRRALANEMTQYNLSKSVRIESLASRIQSVKGCIRENLERHASLSGYASVPWGSGAWQIWSPCNNQSFSFLVCFVQLDAAPFAFLGAIKPPCEMFPLYFELKGGHGLLLNIAGSESFKQNSFVESMVLRILANVPPGKARFTFIDPIGLGNNVSGLLSMQDYDDQLINSRAWSDNRHIDQRLAEIIEHMETVIQKYLRQDYQTIVEYNETAGEIAEPFHFVFVFDFPSNFSEQTAKRLISIAKNGPRCGVYPVVLRNPSQPMPYGVILSDLENALLVIDINELGAKIRQSRFENWNVQFVPPPPVDLRGRIIHEAGSLAKDARKVEVPYEKLLSIAGMRDTSYWTASSANTIEVPMGPEGARRVRNLVFGLGTAHHGLIVGKTGSGKSNLMHVIITTLALKYSSLELQMYLIDFKQGVEFKAYATHKLPHALAIAVESEREFALSVMERLEQELKIRGDLFRRSGAVNLADYRAKNANSVSPLPRILLLVDEFQEFFREDDHLSRRVAAILNQLVLQGRSNGIHVLLGTQSLSNVHGLSRGTFDQMGVRIALQCSEADSRLILAEDNPAARLISKPGEAIYNDQGGLVEGNKPFQSAMIDMDRDGTAMLSAIRCMAVTQSLKLGLPTNEPIVFSGNELACIEMCRDLHSMMEAPFSRTGSKTIRMLLGEPVAIRPTCTVKFTKQSGSHLLIVSLNEQECANMAISAMISALVQHSPDDLRLVVANFFSAEEPVANFINEFPLKFPHSIQIISKQRELIQQIRLLAAEARRRGDAGGHGPSILIFLLGLQRIKTLRDGDDSIPYEDTIERPCEFFATVLREGAECGIHVVATCDNVTNASRAMDRRLLSQIGSRVACSMNESDSMNFLDSPAAARLDKPHRAILFDESKPGMLEKFVPFGLPSVEFVSIAGKSVGQRDNPQS